MTFTTKQAQDFDDAVRAIRDTQPGKEAGMYTCLYGLFVDGLNPTAGVDGGQTLAFHSPFTLRRSGL